MRTKPVCHSLLCSQNLAYIAKKAKCPDLLKSTMMECSGQRDGRDWKWGKETIRDTDPDSGMAAWSCFHMALLGFSAHWCQRWRREEKPHAFAVTLSHCKLHLWNSKPPNGSWPWRPSILALLLRHKELVFDSNPSLKKMMGKRETHLKLPDVAHVNRTFNRLWTPTYFVF